MMKSNNSRTKWKGYQQHCVLTIWSRSATETTSFCFFSCFFSPSSYKNGSRQSTITKHGSAYGRSTSSWNQRVLVLPKPILLRTMSLRSQAFGGSRSTEPPKQVVRSMSSKTLAEVYATTHNHRTWSVLWWRRSHGFQHWVSKSSRSIASFWTVHCKTGACKTTCEGHR